MLKLLKGNLIKSLTKKGVRVQLINLPLQIPIPIWFNFGWQKFSSRHAPIPGPQTSPSSRTQTMQHSHGSCINSGQVISSGLGHSVGQLLEHTVDNLSITNRLSAVSLLSMVATSGKSAAERVRIRQYWDWYDHVWCIVKSDKVSTRLITLLFVGSNGITNWRPPGDEGWRKWWEIYLEHQLPSIPDDAWWW